MDKSINPLRSVAVALAAGLVFGLSGCGSEVPDTIKIGVGTTLSGSSANRGIDVLNGVKLAVEELHRQGYKVDGKVVKFEIVQADDKGTVEGGKAAAQQLVDQGVSVAFGHLASDVTLAAVPVYQAKNLPLVTKDIADVNVMVNAMLDIRAMISPRVEGELPRLRKLAEEITALIEKEYP